MRKKDSDNGTHRVPTSTYILTAEIYGRIVNLASSSSVAGGREKRDFVVYLHHSTLPVRTLWIVPTLEYSTYSIPKLYSRYVTSAKTLALQKLNLAN
jgi:acetoacetate decarboxylase